jgi:ubiquinone/menaquinone biosynthesis C-methylase UbiE
MAGSYKAEDTYPMGRSKAETERLIEQAGLFALPLRRLFEDAGLAPGMRVLDLGSGAGDVAMAAAELVGPSGEVVGVDMNAAILETARARTGAAGYANVHFLAGDLRDGVEVAGEFDALVGRYVLLYLEDPAAMLRPFVRRLRPGGVAAFQDTAVELSFVAQPPSPLLSLAVGWLGAGLRAAGARLWTGFGLYQVFQEAGLEAPRMRATASVGGGPDWEGYEHLAGGLRSLMPVLEKHGIATAAQVGVDTLAERLRDEFVRERKAGMGLVLVDAWARKP